VDQALLLTSCTSFGAAYNDQMARKFIYTWLAKLTCISGAAGLLFSFLAAIPSSPRFVRVRDGRLMTGYPPEWIVREVRREDICKIRARGASVRVSVAEGKP